MEIRDFADKYPNSPFVLSNSANLGQVTSGGFEQETLTIARGMQRLVHEATGENIRY